MSEQNTGGNKSELPTKIGVLLFPGFEPLDAFGPLEAFQTLAWRTKLDLLVINGTLEPFHVVPTHTYEAVPADLDVLLIPGGWGAFNPSDARLSFIARTYPRLKYLITVCNGAGLAAQAGVLDGKRATTNKAFWEPIVALGPRVKWVRSARYVIDGNVWTSGGVSAGLDVACAWIAEVYGRELAREVASRMEYEWRDDPNWDPFWYMFSTDKMDVGLKVEE